MTRPLFFRLSCCLCGWNPLRMANVRSRRSPVASLESTRTDDAASLQLPACRNERSWRLGAVGCPYRPVKLSVDSASAGGSPGRPASVSVGVCPVVTEEARTESRPEKNQPSGGRKTTAGSREEPGRLSLWGTDSADIGYPAGATLVSFDPGPLRASPIVAWICRKIQILGNHFYVQLYV